MPLFYQHNINDATKLAVWHITETEDFFLEKVTGQKNISHPHKKLQHLAGRYLLQFLHPDFPVHLISISDSKKPVLLNGDFHFSISHCGDYAAAIVSDNKTVGIDVELVTPKIEKIKNKFLGEEEINRLKNNQFSVSGSQFLTLAWSTKEAIFKWYGKGAVDFKKDINIHQVIFKNERGTINAYFIKEGIIDLEIQFQFFQSLCLVWLTK